MPLRSSTNGLLSLVAASLLWAFSFGLIRTHLTGLDAYLVASVRLALSFLLFLPLMRIRGIEWRVTVRLLAIGAVQYGVMYVAYIQSYQYLKGHEVALFTIFTPLYVALLHTTGCSRRWRILAAALLAVLGAAVIVFERPNRMVAMHGVLLLQVANMAFAFGQVAYRRVMQRVEAPVGDTNVCAVMFAGGMVLAAACGLSGGWGQIHVSGVQLAVLLYLGVIPSGIGFFLWNRGARRARYGTLAVTNNMKIPLAVLAAITLFGEQADLVRLCVGGGLMLLSVWFCEKNA